MKTIRKLIFEINGKVVETLDGNRATLDDITLIKVAMAIKYSVQIDDVDVLTKEEDVTYVFDSKKIRASRIQLAIINGRYIKKNFILN